MSRRFFSSIADSTVTTSAITTTGQNSVQVASISGFPTVPFTGCLERGTANEELVEVTAINTGTKTLTITRGIDSTTPTTHVVTSTFDHDASARDFQDANDHIFAGSSLHLGSNNVDGTNITTGVFSIPSSTVNISGALNVTGQATITGHETHLSYTGTFVDPEIGTNRALKIGDTGAMIKGGTHTDTLTVDGSTLLGALTVSSGTLLAGLTAGATSLGATTISSTLGVTGTLTASGQVSIAGDTLLNSSSTAEVYNPNTVTGNPYGTGGYGNLDYGSLALVGIQIRTAGTNLLDLNVQSGGSVRMGNGLEVLGGTVTFPAHSVTGSSIAYDSITGAAGAGLGQIAASTIQSYNLADGAVTSSKLSAGAITSTSVALGTLRDTKFSMFRTATSATTDVSGQPVGNLIVPSTAVRATDANAFDGQAIRFIAGTTTNLAQSTGPYYGAVGQGPGLSPGFYRVTFYMKAGTASSPTQPAFGLDVFCGTGSVVQENGTQTVFTPSQLGTSGYIGCAIPCTILADTAGTLGLQTRVTFHNDAGADVYLSHVTIEPAQSPFQGEITTQFIAALAVGNAQISDLSVAKLTAGSITSDDIYLGTGGHIYAGTKGGARVELNAGGLYAYDASLNNTFSILNTGSAFFAGTLHAKSGSFDGDILLNTGSLYAGSSPTSGQRLVFNSSGITGFDSIGTQKLTIGPDGTLNAQNATFQGNIQTGSSVIGSTFNGGTIVIGTGNNSFHADGSGIYLGNVTFASAPFHVDMTGALTASSANITGIINATSGNFGSGVITGGVFQGGTFQTNSSGARVVIDNTNGFQAYNSSNTLISQIPISGGTAGQLTATGATITGTINATGGTFSGTVTGGTFSGAAVVGGSFKTSTNTSAARVEIDSNGVRGYPADRTVTASITTGTNLLAATTTWQPQDVGRTVVGPGIPSNTTMLGVVNPFTAALSANATSTQSGQTFTLTGNTFNFDTSSGYVNGGIIIGGFYSTNTDHNTPRILLGPSGFTAYKSNPSRTVANVSTTNGNNTLSSTDFALTSDDVGRSISGTGIPGGSVITGLGAAGSPRSVICTLTFNNTIIFGTFFSSDTNATITGTGIPAGTTIVSVTNSGTAIISNATTSGGSQTLTVSGGLAISCTISNNATATGTVTGTISSGTLTSVSIAPSSGQISAAGVQAGLTNRNIFIGNYGGTTAYNTNSAIFFQGTSQTYSDPSIYIGQNGNMKDVMTFWHGSTVNVSGLNGFWLDPDAGFQLADEMGLFDGGTHPGRIWFRPGNSTFGMTTAISMSHLFHLRFPTITVLKPSGTWPVNLADYTTFDVTYPSTMVNRPQVSLQSSWGSNATGHQPPPLATAMNSSASGCTVSVVAATSSILANYQVDIDFIAMA